MLQRSLFSSCFEGKRRIEFLIVKQSLIDAAFIKLIFLPLIATIACEFAILNCLA
jgi:hypothetical protein